MSFVTRAILAPVVLAGLALGSFGCGQDSPPVDASKSSGVSVRPNNFSDNTYKNGVLYGEAAKQKGSGFYFLLPKGQSNPVKVGTVLRFAKSGEAKVVAISHLEAGDTSSIFVTVDKALDGEGDGYPNQVMLVR